MNTMDCADIKAMLSGLVDDEVEPTSRHQAERHLAECKACRDMIDEAEALDRLITIEAEDSFNTLPEGFEAAVFATINEPAQPVMTSYAMRWTTWAGWMAAAASLALALTIWVMDRKSSFFESPTNSQARVLPDRDFPEIDILVDAPPVTVMTTSLTWAPVFDTALDPLADTSMFALPQSDDAFESTSVRDEVTGLVKKKSRELSALSDRPTLSVDDAQILYNASILLEMIAESDTNSFTDIEMARQILVYDELLPRLAQVRVALNPADRPSVLAAESILTRIVQGPIDLEDIRMLRETVLQLKLADEVATLSNRGPKGGSA
ncbi:MAG: zf-HC2 domain-containing protein [Planctomycetota bacterium]|nr:zf-HC2 domain-containing protein [Planctomycetota bacterium]